MAAIIGVDEIKAAIVNTLTAGMAAAIAAVNADRADGITIIAPATYVTSDRDNINQLGSPVCVVTIKNPKKNKEVGDRQIWHYEGFISMRYIGRGEIADTVKKKLERYRDVINRILGAYANNTLGGVVWETNILGATTTNDKPLSGWAEVRIEIWTNN